MTPLFKKLNLGVHERILVLNSPESFEAELEHLGDNIKILRRATAKTSVSFSIGFATTRAELDSVCKKLIHSAADDAVVWIAYPKKSSRRYQCEFDRDSGWTELGAAGYEGVRQVAIDEDWSALRFRQVEHIKKMTRNNKMAISQTGKKRTKRK